MRRLYDPHYVRHLVSDGAAIQVCVDSRMLGVRGTGVATYASVLAACLKAAGASRAVLAEESRGEVVLARPRLERWVSAMRGGTRQARRSTYSSSSMEGSDADEEWSASDVFREAQVFFNIHGKLLPVICAAPPKVMHWTYPVPLYVRGAKNLYTIHDLIPLENPKLSPVSKRRHAKLLRRVSEAAERLVTVSESSRAAIITHLGCSPDFVVNTYQAVHTPLQHDPPLPADLIPGGYFLFFGSVERRKNLLRLIEAHQASQVQTPLVIAGPDGWGAQSLVRPLANSIGIIRLPWQPRATLLALIRQARAVCFPTLAEGFGLPVAEAMALGAPVLTSDRGALAEIAADAALTADPSDVPALAQAILRLDTDQSLRRKLRAAGFKRARMFTLPVYATRLRALYAETVRTSAGLSKNAATGSRSRS